MTSSVVMGLSRCAANFCGSIGRICCKIVVKAWGSTSRGPNFCAECFKKVATMFEMLCELCHRCPVSVVSLGCRVACAV